MSRKPKFKMKKKAAPKQDAGIVPLHNRKAKEREMNDAGFYEGMPGCTLDENGYRKMIDFVVTPDGDNNAIMYAHPQFVVVCVEKSLEHKELKDLMLSAFVNHLFKKKSPFQFFLRLAYRVKARRGRKAYEKARDIANKLREDEQAQIHKDAPEVVEDVPRVQEGVEG